MKVIERKTMNVMFDILKEYGYKIAGPTIKEQAIVYDELESINDLPIGWTDEQEAAAYRLKKRNDKALFGYVVGPHSWKKYLFPPRVKLLDIEKNGKGFKVHENSNHTGKYAFVGVRGCELNAISIQDKVFANGEYTDPIYKKLRENIFIIAVNCTEPKGTCFCVSMNTGPRVKKGYDLCLTEIIDEKKHYFAVETGSEKGEEILNRLNAKEADQNNIEAVEKLMKSASKKMGREMDTNGIKELLYNNSAHPQWNDVSQRCLTCTNCTMVCPTCFCSTVEDLTDLTGDKAERWRRWDSCFSLDYSRVAGGNFRLSPMARYRQWMTHKLAYWIDQFGTSGCVGCGRCITWCPVGIDITKEVQAIRNSTVKTQTKKG
jgi:sulfhydrogenase subunit beta (sulfur reductase)